MGGGFPVLKLLQGKLGERFKATITDFKVEGKATGYRRGNLGHSGPRATCAISGSKGSGYGAAANRRSSNLWGLQH